MKKIIALLMALAMVCCLTACGNNAEEEVVDGGEPEKSNKLVIYSPNSDTLIDNVIPVFEEKYGIEAEVLTMGTGECLTRLNSEMNDPYADIMYGGMNPANADNNPDLFENYISPNDKNLPEAYQSYKGYVNHYGLDGSAALLINLDVFEELGLDPEEFKGYEDLLRPELKGHIAMGNPAKSSSAWAELTNMLLVMGDEPYDEKAWEWVAKFADQLDGKIVDSSGAIYKGTAEGEYAVGVSYEDPCVSLLVDGATNVKLVYPEEGSVWLPAGCSIIKNAPNMENAKLFIDFLLSDEGQEAIGTTTCRPSNVNIKNSAEEMIPFDQINVAYEDILFCAENKVDWQQRWLDLIEK